MHQIGEGGVGLEVVIVFHILLTASTHWLRGLFHLLLLHLYSRVRHLGLKHGAPCGRTRALSRLGRAVPGHEWLRLGYCALGVLVRVCWVL